VMQGGIIKGILDDIKEIKANGSWTEYGRRGLALRRCIGGTKGRDCDEQQTCN
jgi:hypothetical protein